MKSNPIDVIECCTIVDRMKESRCQGGSQARQNATEQEGKDDTDHTR